MKVTSLILFLFCVLNPFVHYAQDYSIQILEDEYDFCCNELMVNESEEAFLLSYESATPYFYLTEVNPTNTQNRSFQFEYKNGSRPWLPEWQIVGTLFTEDFLFFQHMPEKDLTTSLLFFNTKDQSFWARKIKYFGIHHRLAFSKEDDLLYSFQTQGHAQNQDAFTMKAFCFDIEGNNIWQNGYRFTSSFFVSQVNLAAVTIQEENLFAIMALGRPEDFATGVVKLDLQGNVEESIIIDDHSEVFNLAVSDAGFIYLMGETIRDENDLGLNKNAVLIKMDQDLNVIWSKILSAESFDIRASQINCVGEDVYLAYSSFGNLSVILAKINSEGQIIDQKGLPHYQPKLNISSNGVFYLTYDEERDQQGMLVNKSGIIKNVLENESSNCSFYTSCLELIPFETETRILNVTRNDVSEAELDTLFMEEKSVTIEDYCFDLEVPEPNFEFPDTLCRLSCESPLAFAENNLLEEQWMLRNESFDTLFLGAKSQEWCFEEEGLYEVIHTLWYLGCAHEHVEKVWIVGAFNFEIDEIIPPCLLEAPNILSLNSLQQIKSAKWNTGAEGTTIEVFESGTYSVTATDGFCEHELSVDVFRPEISVDEIINFEEQEFICRSSLPHTIFPNSNFSNLFFIDGQIASDSVVFTEFGSYLIQTEFDNCILEKEFNLLEDDCEVAIYFPSVFSPNRDGINDEILPLGKGFEIEIMRVYDRWGTMVFETSELQHSWDGYFRGKALDPGIYFYTLRYRNEKSLRIENVQGDFLLKR